MLLVELCLLREEVNTSHKRIKLFTEEIHPKKNVVRVRSTQYITQLSAEMKSEKK